MLSGLYYIVYDIKIVKSDKAVVVKELENWEEGIEKCGTKGSDFG